MDPRIQKYVQISYPTNERSIFDNHQIEPRELKSYSTLISEQFARGLPFCLAVVQDEDCLNLTHFSWSKSLLSERNPITTNKIKAIFLYLIKPETPNCFQYILQSKPGCYDNATLISFNCLLPALNGDKTKQQALAGFYEIGLAGCPEQNVYGLPRDTTEQRYWENKANS